MPDEDDLQRIEAKLRAINATAPIRRTTRSHVSVDAVLGIDGFDLQRALTRDPSFLDAKKAPTKHSVSVSSHSIDQGAARHLRGGAKSGQLDLALTQEWLGELMHEKGEDLYRMKGVLAIAHAEQRFVFHSVHMLMEGSFEAEWGDEPRESKLVFIGKDLDPAKLTDGFNNVRRS